MLVLQADGGCWPNPGGRGRGAFAAFRDGKLIHEAVERLDATTNNVAEWTGCLLALRWASTQSDQAVLLQMDSQLVVHQLTGRWRVKKPHLQPLATEGQQLVSRLVRKGIKVEIRWIPRTQNTHADSLTR